VTVARFFFRREFGESLLDLRKIEHGVVAESAGTLEVIENAALGDSAKRCQRQTIAGGGDYTHEASRALFGRNALEFAKNARIVGIIIGVGIGLVRLVGCVAGGMNTGSAMEGVNFKAGIVGDDDLSGQGQAVLLGSLASTTRSNFEKLGIGWIRTLWAEAAPAKSRSLPGFEVAMKVVFIRQNS